MLRNSFYTLKELNTTQSDLTAVINFNPRHDIFRGHFPGQPVVPGVCMIQIVKETLEMACGQKLLLRHGQQIKFLRLIVPDAAQDISINISWKETEDGYVTQASFKNDSEILFKLTGVFQFQLSTAN